MTLEMERSVMSDLIIKWNEAIFKKCVIFFTIIFFLLILFGFSSIFLKNTKEDRRSQENANKRKIVAWSSFI